MPTSSGQERGRVFIDFNKSIQLTVMGIRKVLLLLYSPPQLHSYKKPFRYKSQKSNSPINLVQNNPFRKTAHLIVGRPGRSTVPNRELGHFSLRSTGPVDHYAVHVSVHVGRLDRSTEPLLLPTVDRAGRPHTCSAAVSAAAEFWIPFSFVDPRRLPPPTCILLFGSYSTSQHITSVQQFFFQLLKNI